MAIFVLTMTDKTIMDCLNMRGRYCMHCFGGRSSAEEGVSFGWSRVVSVGHTVSLFC